MAEGGTVEWEKWAKFLGDWVDFRHGKGISNQAWDAYARGLGPYDDETQQSGRAKEDENGRAVD